jgi:hypothetical protein
LLTIRLIQKEGATMIDMVIFLMGFTAGVLVAGLFEQRAVNEILRLRTFLRAELQNLAARL